VRGGLTLAVSAVSWSELLHGALLGRYPDEAVREFAEDLGVEVVPVDVHVAEQGAALQAAYGRTGKRRELRRLRTPDALILGTAARYQEIELVICGDGQWTSVPGVDTDIALLQER
jgi:predicted nucleic acid-binding protein